MKIRTSLFIAILLSGSFVNAQPGRWQQKIAYGIDVNMDVHANRLTGTEKIDYYNNSPDTLKRLFIHLYWNAFQPGSMMDVRSRELGKTVLRTDKNGNPVYDWDGRVRDRISKLQPDEIGYDSVDYVKINGIAQKLIYHETILEVVLSKPILPESKISAELSFKAQVPVQIRRSGRNNAEGIQFSMSQWYPKIAEYDYLGWNANPYIAREFYGVWGDFNVNITIDKNYMLAGTGTLQNANEVGFGYQADGVKVKSPAGKTCTWKFAAQNVHDFVWAADTAYTMIKKKMPDGPIFYFVYKKVDSLEAAWQNTANTIEKAYPYIASTFGAYPYKNYSFIQGGDGGMEYPMATLIKNASVGTAVHEFMHSWYQGMMGTNESLYPWMDEGFTTYAENRITAWLNNNTGFAFEDDYDGYFYLVKSGRQEPMSTHADHFNTNLAYSISSYSMGSIFMEQLGYIIGQQNLDKVLLRYYQLWKFKHPNPDDFIRVAEDVSGMQLQWYKQYWIYSTKTIDYALGDVNAAEDGNAAITIKRTGLMPMPVDVLITFKDGTQQMYNIPINMTYGAKPAENDIPYTVQNEWYWVNPVYDLHLSHTVSDIKSIEIDPSMRMADVNRVNNKVVVP